MADYLLEDFEEIRKDASIDWQALKNSTVFVTGGTGLVGSMLIRALLHYNRTQKGNIRILALVRDLDKAHAVFGKLFEDTALHFIHGDITAPFSVEEPVDYILHGASVTASRTMVEKPVDTLATAIEGTRNTLELAVRKQVKSMVYISSMEAYGITDPEKACILEQDLGYIDILNPRSSYSEGKRICECLCAAYHSQYGVPVKVARLAQTFGAGVSREENRVFAQFAKSALQGRDIVLHTKGESFGNYCYTADALRGLLCILTRGQDSQAYTVVNEATTMRIREMAQLVANTFSAGKSQVVFDIPENLAAMGYAPDSTMRLSAQKLRALGWEPRVDLENMYRRMISQWTQN